MKAELGWRNAGRERCGAAMGVELAHYLYWSHADAVPVLHLWPMTIFWKLTDPDGSVPWAHSGHSPQGVVNSHLFHLYILQQLLTSRFCSWCPQPPFLYPRVPTGKLHGCYVGPGSIWLSDLTYSTHHFSAKLRKNLECTADLYFVFPSFFPRLVVWGTDRYV